MTNMRELPIDTEQMPEWLALELTQTFNERKDPVLVTEDYTVTDPLFSMRMSRIGGGINVPGDGIDDLRLLSAQEMEDEDNDGIPDCEDNDLTKTLKKMRANILKQELG